MKLQDTSTHSIQNRVSKTIFYLCLFLSFGVQFKVEAQKILQAQIILNNNDTLNQNIKVKTSLFSPNDLDVFSVNKQIVIIDSLKKKHTIDATEIKKMTFVDFQQKKRIFVGIFLFKRDQILKELVHDGKIKWYRAYYPHFDGSIVYSEIMINENNETVTIDPINSKRKKLKVITKAKPELAKVIEMNEMTNENILTILQLYDE